jgi:hypothetical protein
MSNTTLKSICIFRFKQLMLNANCSGMWRKHDRIVLLHISRYDFDVFGKLGRTFLLFICKFSQYIKIVPADMQQNNAVMFSSHALAFDICLNLYETDKRKQTCLNIEQRYLFLKRITLYYMLLMSLELDVDKISFTWVCFVYLQTFGTYCLHLIQFLLFIKSM